MKEKRGGVYMQVNVQGQILKVGVSRAQQIYLHIQHFRLRTQ